MLAIAGIAGAESKTIIFVIAPCFCQGLKKM